MYYLLVKIDKRYKLIPNVSPGEELLYEGAKLIKISLDPEFCKDYLDFIEDENRFISQEDMAKFLLFNNKYSQSSAEEKQMIKSRHYQRYVTEILFQVPKDQAQAQQYLRQLWVTYEGEVKEKAQRPLGWYKAYLDTMAISDSGILTPEHHLLGNIFLDCKEGMENSLVFLCPKNLNIMTGSTRNHLVYKNKELKDEDITEEDIKGAECYAKPASKLLKLYEVLQMAFSAGKELVIIPLATKVQFEHAFVGVFSSTGEFLLIDSRTNGLASVGASGPLELTQFLKNSKIKDKNGKPMEFKGDKVNIGIQSLVNHDCSRFTALIAYHTYLTGDMHAYKEVVAAIIEGRLRTVGDHKNISGAGKVDAVTAEHGYTEEKFASFMEAWRYHSAGVPVNNWRDVPMQHLTATGDFQVLRFDRTGAPVDAVEKEAGNHGFHYMDAAGRRPLSEVKPFLYIEPAALREAKTLGQFVEKQLNFE